MGRNLARDEVPGARDATRDLGDSARDATRELGDSARDATAGQAPVKVAARRPLNAKEQLVLEALRRHGKATSAYNLIDDLKPAGVKAPPTVYRALGRLMDAGLVHRLESLNAFIACTHAHCGEAAAFAVCETCGAVEEFQSEQLLSVLESWARQKKFALRQTTVELRGLCAECAGHEAVAEAVPNVRPDAGS